jgi:urease accessory protein
MRRVTGIRRVGEWDPAEAVDRVVLDAADRYRRRIALTGACGTRLLIDWAQPVRLRDGDGLVLEDGAIVAVAGEPEPLLELTISAPTALVRLAWHLGNRHAEVQIGPDRLRIRCDRVLQDMAVGLGAVVTAIEAPFDPEPGPPCHGHAHA